MTDERFEQAARAYGDMIYRVACHAVRNRADAEDVTQTVLLKLYEAVNESRQVLRAFWRRRVVPLDEEWDAPAPEDRDRGEVLRAVMALERKYRLSICLYYYEGCSVKEIAAVMGANPSTVQTWLQRAREKLRAALSEEEEESEYVRS